MFNCNIDRDVYEKLNAAVIDSKMAEKYAQLVGEFDRRLKERIGEIVQKYGSEGNIELKLEAELKAKEARDQHLNLACPHCKVAYFDFDGCMVLQCASCHKHFCAYCHTPCSTSQGAHTHVRECLMNDTANGMFKFCG